MYLKCKVFREVPIKNQTGFLLKHVINGAAVRFVPTTPSVQKHKIYTKSSTQK
jgi:hypothetical protein